MGYITKIKRVLSIIIMVIATVMVAGEANAQTAYKTVNHKTYVFDNKKNVVYNRAKVAKNARFYATEGFSVNDPSLVSSTFKKILTASRLKELKKDKVAVIFECNDSGKIESVEFVFNKTPFLSVSEIEQLEESFLTQSFSITSNSKRDGQYIKFAIPCFFSRIQK